MTSSEFLPYSRQSIDEEEIRAVVEVLRSDRLTQGPLVEAFEAALARYCGARHAIAVSSGTAALHLALLACDLRAGDLVATTPLTFVATASCICHAGGAPRFVDVEPDTLNLDPSRLEALLAGEEGSRVRGVVPVHFAGCPADVEQIASIARRRGLFVLEDASHALGARWRDAAGELRRVGACSHSDLATVSFHPVKHITTAEGGAVLTNDAALAERIRALRSHGQLRDPVRLAQRDGAWSYEVHELGFNYRLTDLQCALGLVQLGKLDDWLERRAQLVKRYRKALAGDARIRWVTEPPGTQPAWHLFTIQVPRRAEVFQQLTDAGIGVQVHYLPVHLQPYFRERFGTAAGDHPCAEIYYEQALSLPLFPAMDDADVDRVVTALLRALSTRETEGSPT
jgi:UDP-4-amino-4,6-dideoxy-N-acetyl-beta-L-altrosamine transaminase